MEKFILFVFLIMTTKGLAQPADAIKNKLIPVDSISVKAQTTVPPMDSVMRNEDMERNVSNLLNLQKSIQARERKEKRNALTRIGIGVALLIILVIGLRRKTVKKQGKVNSK